MRKYTSKEICQFFNIKRDTLRHYEALGIIHPTIDPKNNYRLYDKYDIYSIAECKKYQTIEMPLKDISYTQNQGSLESLISSMEKLQISLEYQAFYYEKLSKKNLSYIQTLKQLKRLVNTIEEVEIEEGYLLPSLVDSSIQPLDDFSDTHYFAFKHYAFFDNALYFTFDDYNDDQDMFTMGFYINKYYAEVINAPIDKMMKIPKGRALRCVIDAGEKGNLTYKLFSALIDYAQEHHMKPKGYIYGVLLSRTYEQGAYCRYFDVYMPLY